MRQVFVYIVGGIVVIIVVSWVVTNPAGAGSTVHGWIASVITFCKSVATG